MCVKVLSELKSPYHSAQYNTKNYVITLYFVFKLNFAKIFHPHFDNFFLENPRLCFFTFQKFQQSHYWYCLAFLENFEAGIEIFESILIKRPWYSSTAVKNWDQTFHVTLAVILNTAYASFLWPIKMIWKIFQGSLDQMFNSFPPKLELSGNRDIR